MLLISTGLFAAEPKPGVHKQSVGMVFQVQALTGPVANVTMYEPLVGPIVTGVGIRFWILEEVVLRAIVFFNLNYASATDETTIRAGLSLGAQYHFVKGVVSPYAGVLGGAEILSSPLATGADWHLGAVVGVELSPWPFLAVFLEYSLMATFQEAGTEIDLGFNHAPTLGVIIYLN
jgi:hypothetical protein